MIRLSFILISFILFFDNSRASEEDSVRTGNFIPYFNHHLQFSLFLNEFGYVAEHHTSKLRTTDYGISFHYVNWADYTSLFYTFSSEYYNYCRIYQQRGINFRAERKIFCTEKSKFYSSFGTEAGFYFTNPKSMMPEYDLSSSAITRYYIEKLHALRMGFYYSFGKRSEYGDMLRIIIGARIQYYSIDYFLERTVNVNQLDQIGIHKAENGFYLRPIIRFSGTYVIKYGKK
jgi:hypothetical protein